jgi:chromosome segregation ATPase
VNPDTLKQDYDELKEEHEMFTKLIADKFMQMNRGLIKLQAERNEARTEVEKLREDYNMLARLSDGRVKQLQEELSDSTNHYNGIINDLVKLRDEARAEVERLKQSLHDARLENSGQAAQLERTRPEPSRLEIAAMLYKGMLSSGYIWGDPEKTAIRSADALIAAAKEVTK